MKFTVTMKDPDGVYESLRSAAEESIEDLDKLSVDEQRNLINSRVDSLDHDISKWVRFGECIAVEFDTEAGTATVVKS